MIAHAGATVLMAGVAQQRAARARAVADNGGLPLPVGNALEALNSPLYWHGAALAYTATVGLFAVLVADLLARMTRRAGLGWRMLPVALIVLLWAVAAAATATFAWWSWLALITLAVYGCRCRSHGRDRGAPAPPAWSAPACAVILLLPPIVSADDQLLRDIRTGLLAVPAGTAAVNAYYRHALLAAEPIKRPRERLFATYVWRGSPTTDPPGWITCRRRPWPLLAVDEPRYADLQFGLDQSGEVVLAGDEAPAVLARDRALSVLTRDAERRDPAVLRWVVTIGVLAGPVGVFAGGTIVIVRRLSGGRAVWSMAASAVVGGALAAVIGAAPGPSSPAADGGPAERLAAVRDSATPLIVLQRLARADPLLPVRAHALANWIERQGVEPAAVESMEAAETWYEQWHGYRALLAHGWHPSGQRCNGRRQPAG